MKSFFLIIGSLLVTLHGLAQDPQEADAKLEEARKLSEAGNHREAADLAKVLLLPSTPATSETRAEALSYAQDLLRALSLDKADETLEKAVADFPSDWRVLQRAGSLLYRSDHYGYILDGVFHRGANRNRGQWKSCELRDRVRTLQLTFAAWEKIQSDPKATADDKANVIDSMLFGLDHWNGNNTAAWRLQILTDLSKLPDYDEQEGGDEPANGYPVNENGEPVFFKAAASWETAASDGERLFWLLNEKVK